MNPELPLEAPEEILAILSTYIGQGPIKIRRNGITSHYTRSLTIRFIQEALEKGYIIDRSNEDGPIHQWDGWLVIQRKSPLGEPEKLEIKTNHK